MSRPKAPINAANAERTAKAAQASQKAREDHDAGVKARDDNMARLKALRMEKEKAEAELVASQPKPVPKTRKSPRAARAS